MQVVDQDKPSVLNRTTIAAAAHECKLMFQVLLRPNNQPPAHQAPSRQWSVGAMLYKINSICCVKQKATQPAVWLLPKGLTQGVQL